ncbi:MAG: fibronectin type III domain-containing protein [Candidatus Zixiibacteriota bacterium]
MCKKHITNLSLILAVASGLNIALVMSTCAQALRAPSNLKATRGAYADSIVLTWQDNSNDETGFEIQRSLASQLDFKTIAYVGANEIKYVDFDTTLKPMVQFNYRILAFKGSKAEEESDPSDFTTGCTKEEEVPEAPLRHMPATVQGESGPSRQTTLPRGETIRHTPVTRVDSIVMVLAPEVQDTVRSILSTANLIYTGPQILPYTPLVVNNDGIPGAPAKVVGREEQGYCNTIALTEAGGRTAIWLTVTYSVTPRTRVSGTSYLIPFALISPGYNSKNPSQVLVTGYDLKPGTPLHFLEASDPTGMKWHNHDSSHQIPLLGTRMYVMPQNVEASFFPTQGESFHMLSVFDQRSQGGGRYYLYAVQDRRLVLVFETSYESLRDEERNRNYLLAVVGGTFTSGNGLPSIGLSMKMK